MGDPSQTSAWKSLRAHYERVADAQMRDLFRDDPERAERFSLTLGDLLFDYSKNRITAETLSLLVQLAEECGVPDWIARMFSGAPINETEGRAVLHTALRNRGDREVVVGGTDVMPDVRRVLAQMRSFTEAVREGTWVGHTGQAITDVVNIGIGGSDLGPVMASEALRHYRETAKFQNWIPYIRSEIFSKMYDDSIWPKNLPNFLAFSAVSSCSP